MREHMGTGIKREGSTGAAELLGYQLGRYSYREGKRCGCVTEIVQSDVRQTSFPQEWLEVLLYQVLFVDRITIGRW